MMRIQLSSGYGPAECELAVGKLLAALQKEFPSLAVLETVRGQNPGCLRSAVCESDENLLPLEGAVQWICQSPFRPRHRRKNWYVDISVCATAEKLDYDENLVRFETFRSGGKGGQHVNKVETGVRAVYLPTGLAAVSTETRSQQMNKRIALDRLCGLLARQNAAGEESLRVLNRLEHSRLERGNPVRVYEGSEFRRIK